MANFVAAAARFDAIASLEIGTCSDRATTHLTATLAPDWTRSYHPNFHAAADHLIRQGGILLIPHIHPLNQTLTLAADWQIVPEFSFPYDNPPLHLAVADLEPPGGARATICAALPPLRPLLSEAAEKHFAAEMVYVDVANTQDAARACAAGAADCCITNQCGLDKFGLISLARLKHIKVWWLAFEHQKKGVLR